MAFLKEILRPNLAITKKGYKKHDTALKTNKQITYPPKRIKIRYRLNQSKNS